MDTISNNLANVNTTGFKHSRADFQDLMYQQMRPAGATVADGATTPDRPGGRPRRPARRRPRPCSSRAPSRTPATRSTSPSTAAASYKVLLPDGTTRLHPRRLVQAGQPGQAGQLGRLRHPAGDHRAHRTPPGHRHRRGRHGVRGPAPATRHAAGRRQDRPDRLLQPGGPGLTWAATTSRRAPPRAPPLPTAPPASRATARSRKASLERLQRPDRAGDGQHDHRPARLRV